MLDIGVVRVVIDCEVNCDISVVLLVALVRGDVDVDVEVDVSVVVEVVIVEIVEVIVVDWDGKVFEVTDSNLVVGLSVETLDATVVENKNVICCVVTVLVVSKLLLDCELIDVVAVWNNTVERVEGNRDEAGVLFKSVVISLDDVCWKLVDIWFVENDDVPELLELDDETKLLVDWNSGKVEDVINVEVSPVVW